MLAKKIYYHHTDSGGVVYYAKFLEFLEEARTEFLLEKGVSIPQLAKESTLFVVSRQEIDYKLPAFYADSLKIESHISKARGCRIEFEHEIKNQDNQVVSQAKTVLVCVDRGLKPKLIPQQILNLLL